MSERNVKFNWEKLGRYFSGSIALAAIMNLAANAGSRQLLKPPPEYLSGTKGRMTYWVDLTEGVGAVGVKDDGGRIKGSSETPFYPETLGATSSRFVGEIYKDLLGVEADLYSLWLVEGSKEMAECLEEASPDSTIPAPLEEYTFNLQVAEGASWSIDTQKCIVENGVLGPALDARKAMYKEEVRKANEDLNSAAVLGMVGLAASVSIFGASNSSVRTLAGKIGKSAGEVVEEFKAKRSGKKQGGWSQIPDKPLTSRQIRDIKSSHPPVNKSK